MRVPNLRSFVRKALKAAIPAVVAALVLAPALPARAQGVTVPNFWDPGENLVRPACPAEDDLAYVAGGAVLRTQGEGARLERP